MPTFHRPLLIRNPTAGVAWSHHRLWRVMSGLKDWLPSLEVVTTSGPGEALELARRESRRGSDLVIAAGGDGTVHEVLNGIVGSNCALAVLPSGTGNSIAREIGLPVHLSNPVRALRQGEVRDAFLGLADHRYFGLMVGVGFDGYAVHQVPYRLKRIFGRLSYVFVGILALFRYSYPAFTVQVDGKPFRVTTAIIAKSKYYASSFKILPNASLEKPELDVCLFTGAGPWQYLKYVLAVMLHRHFHLKGVLILKAQHVLIDPVSGVLAQIDGESLQTIPGIVRLAAERIRVLFPK